MDQKEYEAKMREILDREDTSESERARTAYDFMILTMMQLLKSSK